jgi:hypothetical protein
VPLFNWNLIQFAHQPDAHNINNQKVHQSTQWTILFQTSEWIEILNGLKKTKELLPLLLVMLGLSRLQSHGRNGETEQRMPNITLIQNLMRIWEFHKILKWSLRINMETHIIGKWHHIKKKNRKKKLLEPIMPLSTIQHFLCYNFNLTQSALQPDALNTNKMQVQNHTQWTILFQTLEWIRILLPQNKMKKLLPHLLVTDGLSKLQNHGKNIETEQRILTITLIQNFLRIWEFQQIPKKLQKARKILKVLHSVGD